MVSFTYWALTDGQSAEATLGYAPLPAEIQQKSIDELHKVTSGGTPGLALVPGVLSSSADRPRRSGRGRSARSIARRHRTSGRQ